MHKIDIVYALIEKEYKQKNDVKISTESIKGIFYTLTNAEKYLDSLHVSNKENYFIKVFNLKLI